MNKSIITKFMAGAVALSTVSCEKRGAIHQVSDKVKYPIIERVDSFAKSSLNKADTTDLEKFAVDTLEITNKNMNNKNKFINLLNRKANQANPDVNMGPRVEYGYGLRMNGKMGYGIVLKQHYEPAFEPSSVVGTMQNKVYANKKGDRFFVPINCYGKPNPEAME